MKNSRKLFVLIEAILAAMVVLLAFVMFWEKSGRELKKISVIIQNSDDSRWAAFKYGLRMAAEDQKAEVFVVSTGEILTVEEQKELIENELENGAAAVIVEPVPQAEKMLKKIAGKVPVMLVEHGASGEGAAYSLPEAGPDHYALGETLGEELLKDYNGNLEGKTLGILSQNAKETAGEERSSGFLKAVEGAGASVKWSVSGPFLEADEHALNRQPKVDIVIALDDTSLTIAGKASAAKNLHGSLLYGIGNSTEAVYYLDTGVLECLVVPDEFSVGYKSLTETAKHIKNRFYKQKDVVVSHTVLRSDTLFAPENQEILFTMSQ